MNFVSNTYARFFMSSLETESVQLVWTDPPFGTGNDQVLLSSGLTYRDNISPTVLLREIQHELLRVLSPSGMLVVCLNHIGVHEVAVQLKKSFYYQGEIIWTSELGGVPKSWWANKHNTLLLFSKSSSPLFKYEEVPTMIRKSEAYGKLGEQKKVTSVWNFTMSNSDRQRVGYPSQKPLEIVLPFIDVHTNPGDLVVDPFAGSGTVAHAAVLRDRRFAINDLNLHAVDVIESRLRSIDKPLQTSWEIRKDLEGKEKKRLSVQLTRFGVSSSTETHLDFL